MAAESRLEGIELIGEEGISCWAGGVPMTCVEQNNKKKIQKDKNHQGGSRARSSTWSEGGRIGRRRLEGRPLVRRDGAASPWCSPSDRNLGRAARLPGSRPVKRYISYICLDGEKRLHYICNKQYTSEYKSANSCKAFSSVYQGSKFSSREIKYFPDQWTLRARGRTFSRNLSSEFKQRTLFSIHSCTIMEQCEEENSSAVYWEDIPKKW